MVNVTHTNTHCIYVYMYICIYMSEIIDRYTENHNKIFFKVWVEKILAPGT